MTFRPDEWARVKELFEGALALAPSLRSSYIASACGDDDALRRQVEALLASHEQANSFLETPPVLGDLLPRNLEGQQLGPYLLESRIAAGGMGEVYKGRDTRLDRTVAIKVRPVRVANDPEARERFEREARVVATLNHPHICTLHDAGKQDGIDFLVMEFLEGETLADRLARGPLPMTLGLQLAVQIVSALDKAHRAGIVHRDLKPGNIFLVRGGKSSAPPTAKLLDFGLAKATGPVVASGGTRDDGDSGSDSAGHHRRDRAIHGSRADRGQGHRRARRSVCVRIGPLRDAQRTQSVRGREQCERDGGHPRTGAATPFKGATTRDPCA